MTMAKLPTLGSHVTWHVTSDEPAITKRGATMFEHDRPDFKDFEYVLNANAWVDVRVSKVGGGTLGETYDGYWHYLVRDLGAGRVWAGSDYRTGMPHTHATVAADLLDCVMCEG